MLWRASARYFQRNRLQTVLALTGIIIGVAAFVAIRLATDSVDRQLRESTHALQGAATHRIVAGSGGIDEQLYVRLRVTDGVRSIAPVVEGTVAMASTDGQHVRVLGVDPFAEQPFRAVTASIRDSERLKHWLTQAGAVLLSKSTARALNAKVGDALRVRSALGDRSLVVTDVIADLDPLHDRALSNVLLMDIASAQETLGLVGRLSYIDVYAAEADADATLSRLRGVLPPGLYLNELAAREAQLGNVTASFRANLTAMSLLALVVGAFLIFNTAMFAALQRRRDFGVLRALGAGRRQILSLVLAEALVLGIIGSVVGVLVGIVLAESLLALVTTTVSDLYVAASSGAVVPTASILGTGIALGMAATLAAGWAPALEAAKIAPISVLARSGLERAAHRLLPIAHWIGIGAMGLAAALLLGTSDTLLPVFAALFLLLFGYALICPALMVGLTRWVERAVARHRSVPLFLGLRSVQASLSRTGPAVAALTVAVATTLGVTLMIGSFRSAVDAWLQHSLRADLYVAVADNTALAHGLPLALREQLAALSGVRHMSMGRRLRLPMESGGGELLALDAPHEGFAGYAFLEGSSAAAWNDFQHQQAVIVSEPYARRHRLHLGQSVRLNTDTGVHAFAIAGVFYDYSSEHGLIVMARSTYMKFWRDEVVTVVGLYLDANTDGTPTLAAARKLIEDQPALIARDNRTVREFSLQIFDRTFAVTEVLRALTLLIAVVGILNAIMALQIERAREWAVARALGLTPRQMRHLLLGQAGYLGFTAGVLAIPIGALIATILAHDVNLRSFGWTIPMTWPTWPLLTAVLLAAGAGVVAGLYPAWRQPPLSARALRDE